MFFEKNNKIHNTLFYWNITKTLHFLLNDAIFCTMFLNFQRCFKKLQNIVQTMHRTPLYAGGNMHISIWNLCRQPKRVRWHWRFAHIELLNLPATTFTSSLADGGEYLLIFLKMKISFSGWRDSQTNETSAVKLELVASGRKVAFSLFHYLLWLGFENHPVTEGRGVNLLQSQLKCFRWLRQPMDENTNFRPWWTRPARNMGWG